MEITRININDTQLNKLQRMKFNKESKENLFNQNNKQQTNMKNKESLAATGMEQNKLSFKRALKKEAAAMIKEKGQDNGSVSFGGDAQGVRINSQYIKKLVNDNVDYFQNAIAASFDPHMLFHLIDRKRLISH